ncbi:hypothetical protein GFY24_38305 [Nocardia sp. SYP-A9097]|uniref:DUF6247 family protein n=1 Tax=Nocardia sp. SYP-A9097 TaxID=2663237 RepID=UPI00129A952E|nr:DUF6247 family protein [Nocardia sp. SYP-A9097]MRH93207.1 hypothetical protein [Nocardia sp. SYP-A9097]
MSSSAAKPDSRPYVPDADPVSIRACLPADVAAAFDRDWDTMMDQAKRSRDITLIHSFLSVWRIRAALEVAEPGSFFRAIEKAEGALERRLRDGTPPDSVSGEVIKAKIAERLRTR